VNRQSIIDYPCQCGHAKINHPLGVYLDLGYNKTRCGVLDCLCDKFNPDNLKYLENQCDKQ